MSGSIGATTPPTLTLAMVGSRMSGGVGVVNCGELYMRNTRVTGAKTFTVTAAALLENTDLEDGSQLTADSLTASVSSISGTLFLNSLLLCTRAVFGKVTAGSISSERCSFGGDVTSLGTFSDTGSDFATGFVVSVATALDWTKTSSLSKVLVNADAFFNQCYVHVAAAGADGAIVGNGSDIRLRGCYVRADDSLFSVSGTGTVSAQGSVSGGCRFDVSTGLVVSQTVSDVRGNAEIGQVALPGDTTLDALGGGTNELYDTFILIGNPVLATVTLYQASVVPRGFEVLIKNSSATDAFDVVAPAPDTLDYVALGVHTIPPLGFARFRMNNTNNWIVC